MSKELEQPQIIQTSQINEMEYLKLTDGLRCELSDLITDVANPLEDFQKKDYEKHFLDYLEEHRPLFQDLEDAYIYSDQKEELVQSLAESLALFAEKELRKEPKKRKRTRRLTDYNMTLVVYVFPALLKENPQSGEPFARGILRSWKEHFPKTNLHIATYGEIESGFKKRYCYITTAVCQSLHKGDDCEELVLLRDYRDSYLMEMSNGQEVIREYYDVAPTIVKHINRRKDSPQIYRNIYDNYLGRCIELIRQGKKEQCRKVYTAMVYDLEEKYFS